ncbi:MAG TPA: OstA-like protein [Prolixibacteraceae bacterium]|nr:OstA-like protein [Prolixibacteraceae bacterium]
MSNHPYRNKKSESLTISVRLLLCFFFMVCVIESSAQQKVKKTITIEKADYLVYDQTVASDAQRLIGNVKISHRNMVLFCDSAWSYQTTNSVDAFGNVHVITNDTVHMYSNMIHYNGNLSMAEARGNVILKDPKLTLTTDSLDFDTKEQVGYYNNGGKIVDSTNTLTSIIGRYYSQNNELFFKDSVKLVNKDYVMNSDTMKYNTKTEIVYIVGPTHIIGDSSYLYSEDGWFDTRKKQSELLKNSTIRKGDTQLQGDYISYNDFSGNGIARGNVVINDFKNSIIIAGNNSSYNDFSQNAFITDSALFIQYQNNDSLFLHADTLYTQPDTSALNQKMVIAFHNVRFFKKDMQGACDSLAYFSKDSTIQLFQDPILWAENNQLTADYIEVINKSVPPSEVRMNQNSFIIQEIDSLKYNQIKGKNMVGLIRGSKLYQINVSGNGQSIYYPADKKSYVGMNKAESSNIILYLNQNRINRISFIKTPVGTLSPLMSQVSPDSQLPDFKWRGAERPINKLDIFRNKNGHPIPLQLPQSEIKKTLPPVFRDKETDLE